MSERLCLVVNGEFDQRITAHQVRRWDSKTTLAPKDLTSEQRAAYGVYNFVDADKIPSLHKAGDISYTISTDTVTEVVAAVPFTDKELEDSNEIILVDTLDNARFFKAFAKVAAEQWGMTSAQLKTAIRSKM